MPPNTLAITCALLVLLTLTSIQSGRKRLEGAAKTGASLAFIAYGLGQGVLEMGAPGAAVLVALVLSAVGDVLLVSRDKRAFLGGLVAFLLAHVAYVVAFVLLGLSPTGLWTLLPLGALAWGVWRWIGPRAGRLATPVAAYILVITAMVLAAACALAAEITLQRQGLMGAAVLFFVSDLCVARDRFVAPGFVNRAVGLPLYYGAQLLFAAAITWS